MAEAFAGPGGSPGLACIAVGVAPGADAIFPALAPRRPPSAPAYVSVAGIVGYLDHGDGVRFGTCRPSDSVPVVAGLLVPRPPTTEAGVGGPVLALQRHPARTAIVDGLAAV
ncbi:MAG TPA: hypothetical protein VGB03_05880, partial [Acidimicrobiales bacterium]